MTLEEAQDFRSSAGIKISSRLVGQQNQRIVRQCPRDGHSLLLPAGKLAGAVVHALVKTDHGGQFPAA